MQVKTIIDEKYKETEIHVCSAVKSEQVQKIAAQIEGLFGTTVAGTDENGRQMLLPGDILRFYAENQKVLAQTKEGVYSVKEKLYELEERLDPRLFLRISKSEIVNLSKIRRLEMDLAGTIRVYIGDGICTYTSRRNVTRLKKAMQQL